MEYVPNNRIEAAALAVKEAFENEHCGARTMSLKTALLLASAAVRAAEQWGADKTQEDGK